MVTQVGHGVAVQPLGAELVDPGQGIKDVVLEFNYKVIPKGDTLFVRNGRGSRRRARRFNKSLSPPPAPRLTFKRSWPRLEITVQRPTDGERG